MLGFLLYTLNIFLCFCMVLIVLPFSLILPPAKRLLNSLPFYWAKMNLVILKSTTRTQLDVHLPPHLSLTKSYIVTANHQSWVDIMVLFNVFTGRIPLLKFFLKQQLKWIPFVGWACWVYGFPFLYRGKSTKRDLAATRKACERFKSEPGSLMIFAEGTRFTPQKHKTQQSPFKHLLKPKAGGMATALECMGDHLQSLIDVTIVYPEGAPSFMDFCRGKIKKITVIAREIPLTQNLRGDYENNPQHRKIFQDFLNHIWTEKDAYF